MMFWVLIIFAFTSLIAPETIALQNDADLLSLIVTAVVSLIAFFAFLSAPLAVWAETSRDLALAVTQKDKVVIYTEKAANLEALLKTIKFPTQARLSKNKDTPVSSITHVLLEAQRNIAQQREEYVDVATRLKARKNGPMSGVFVLTGKGPL